MTLQAKAKIFLADQRGLDGTDGAGSRYTFNFGKYFNEHKESFGDIYAVNDEVLDAGRSLHIAIEQYSYIILLPVMGAIGYKDNAGNDNLVAAGQIDILSIAAGEKIEITNPFDEGLVNFLLVGIKTDILRATRGSSLSTYNVNKCLNGLLKISPANLGASTLPFIVSIGKFEGRGETVYYTKHNNPGLFLFVIEGAFEVHGRLLHARDGLALWDTNTVEIEALSNDAIILLIELSV
jgi:redox-sensitive bicupin YhaK (pirin superfamily)